MLPVILLVGFVLLSQGRSQERREEAAPQPQATTPPGQATGQVVVDSINAGAGLVKTLVDSFKQLMAER